MFTGIIRIFEMFQLSCYFYVVYGFNEVGWLACEVGEHVMEGSVSMSGVNNG